jgi:ribosomal protein S1
MDMNENENFAALFEKSLEETKIKAGDIVEGLVMKLDDKFVFVDVKLKSVGVIPIETNLGKHAYRKKKQNDLRFGTI